MKFSSRFLKVSVLAGFSIGLFACSGEPDPKLEAQKKLEAEAEEIQARTKARIEFKDKHCKELGALDCQKLIKEAGLAGEGKDLY